MWLRLWLIAAVVTAVLADGWQTVDHRPAPKSFANIAQRGNAEAGKATQNRNAANGDGARRTQSMPNINHRQLLSIPDAKLQKLSDAMFKADSNNVAQYITVNYKPNNNLVDQIVLKHEDKVDEIPTYKALRELMGMFPRNLQTFEDDFSYRESAEKNFIEAVLNTKPMQILFDFCARNGVPLDSVADRANFLWRIWFTPFHRLTKEEHEAREHNPSLPSTSTSDKHNDCGFSHVYLGSEEPGHLGGYHNWYVMLKEQATAGFREVASWEYKDAATQKVRAYLKSWIVRYNNVNKLSTFLLGISPELQMALDTLCFIFRMNERCILAVDDQKFSVKAFSFIVPDKSSANGRGKIAVVSSSFPNSDPALNPESKNMAPQSNRRRATY